MSMKSLRQRITSMNGINIPDADYLRVPAGEIRAAIAEVAELRRERDALAARLAEPMVIGACITDGRLHATVMRREANWHVTVLATAEIDVDMLHKRDCLAQMVPAAEPVHRLADE